jgi:hypothetical protein
MEYFTILWITVLSGPLDGSTSGLVYENLEQCEAAINPITDTLEYDYSVICEETVVPSSSIRPKARPEGLAE